MNGVSCNELKNLFENQTNILCEILISLKNMKKYLSSIFLLIIGILIAIIPIHFRDYCVGGEWITLDLALFILLFHLYLISFLIFLLVNFWKMFDGKIFNLSPIFTTVFIIILCLFTYPESSKILVAEPYIYELYEYQGEKTFRLELLENKMFKIIEHDMWYDCNYIGRYSLIKDTLILKRNNIAHITDSIFTTDYLLDQKNNFLYPIENNSIIMDPMRRLKIIIEN